MVAGLPIPRRPILAAVRMAVAALRRVDRGEERVDLGVIGIDFQPLHQDIRGLLRVAEFFMQHGAVEREKVGVAFAARRVSRLVIRLPRILPLGAGGGVLALPPEKVGDVVARVCLVTQVRLVGLESENGAGDVDGLAVPPLLGERASPGEARVGVTRIELPRFFEQPARRGAAALHAAAVSYSLAACRYFSAAAAASPSVASASAQLR